jgi:hypothetical protein
MGSWLMVDGCWLMVVGFGLSVVESSISRGELGGLRQTQDDELQFNL